jgi:hypothetical protein
VRQRRVRDRELQRRLLLGCRHVRSVLDDVRGRPIPRATLHEHQRSRVCAVHGHRQLRHRVLHDGNELDVQRVRRRLLRKWRRVPLVLDGRMPERPIPSDRVLGDRGPCVRAVRRDPQLRIGDVHDRGRSNV